MGGGLAEGAERGAEGAGIGVGTGNEEKGW